MSYVVKPGATLMATGAVDESHTLRNVLIGAGVLAAVGWFLREKKRKTLRQVSLATPETTIVRVVEPKLRTPWG